MRLTDTLDSRYLDDLRALRRTLKHAAPVGKSLKKRQVAQDLMDQKIRHLKVLIKYLETDYRETLERYTTPLLDLPRSSQITNGATASDSGHFAGRD